MILSLSPLSELSAQKREKVNVEANTLEGGRLDGEKFQKLIGSVVFTFKNRNAKIFCDSAQYFKRSGYMNCYSNVKIIEGDSITITSELLKYNLKESVAELRENVIFENDKFRLSTDTLDYNVRNKSAVYFGGGELIDETNDLESNNGFYNTVSKMVNFGGDVILKNPKYTLDTDSLIYDINTKEAVTIGYTKVISKDGGVIESPKGATYNTAIEQSTLFSGKIENDDYILAAKSLYLDKISGMYKADEDVYLRAKKDSVVITGNHAMMDQKNGITKVYGEPVMRKLFAKDTFYLTADTLVSIEDKISKKRELLAYSNVQIFKSDLQAVTDSLVYHMADSMIYFHGSPILWSANNQITADSINITVGQGGLKEMKMRRKAFVIMQDSLGLYNQIKGRDMDVYFDKQKINAIDVDGNSESIYFATNEKKQLMGMNQIICSNMRLIFMNGGLNKITFYKKPEGSFTPIQKIDESKAKLNGFIWYEEKKPKVEEILKKIKLDF